MRSTRGHGRFGRALRALGVARRRNTRPRPHGPDEAARDTHQPLARMVADQLFSRIAGDRSQHNALRLLRDGAENYPAWLDAIANARRNIDFENYIIRNDRTGKRFAAALAAKAREGVSVRLLYDWMGCLGTSPLLWISLRRAGVQVRCFNRPRLDSPFGWLSRNHRKTLSVDGSVGFISGLCVAAVWEADPAHGRPAWRDTGVELHGPAVAELEAAFEQTWSHTGGTARTADAADDPGPAGDVSLRVVASKPNTMGIYRLDQLIAGIARERLWLTDAYFVGTTAYTRTLCDAARDGVDVRLLVPGSSDIPIAKALSRAGYRPLMEAGVRVFEWNGPMLHAKTAVADGRWGRIGSSNLNLASWMGNWELDVAVEDETFAAAMEAMFHDDLRNATEIVIEQSRVHSATRKPKLRARGSPGRLAAGAVGFGSTVTAAITNHRALGPAEAVVMGTGGALLLVVAALALWLPDLVTFPLALLAGWIALTLLVRAGRLAMRGGEAEPPTPAPGHDAEPRRETAITERRAA